MNAFPLKKLQHIMRYRLACNLLYVLTFFLNENMTETYICNKNTREIPLQQ